MTWCGWAARPSGGRARRLGSGQRARAPSRGGRSPSSTRPRSAAASPGRSGSGITTAWKRLARTQRPISFGAFRALAIAIRTSKPRRRRSSAASCVIFRWASHSSGVGLRPGCGSPSAVPNTLAIPSTVIFACSGVASATVCRITSGVIGDAATETRRIRRGGSGTGRGAAFAAPRPVRARLDALTRTSWSCSPWSRAGGPPIAATSSAGSTGARRRRRSGTSCRLRAGTPRSRRPGSRPPRR